MGIGSKMGIGIGIANARRQVVYLKGRGWVGVGVGVGGGDRDGDGMADRRPGRIVEAAVTERIAERAREVVHEEARR